MECCIFFSFYKGLIIKKLKDICILELKREDLKRDKFYRWLYVVYIIVYVNIIYCLI